MRSVKGKSLNLRIAAYCEEESIKNITTPTRKVILSYAGCKMFDKVKGDLTPLLGVGGTSTTRLSLIYEVNKCSDARTGNLGVLITH